MRSRFGHLIVPLGAVALLHACGNKPPPGPTPPPQPAVSRLDLSGPDTIAPGESAQFSVREVLTDGTSRDVTAVAHFRSSSESVLTIAPLGAARALSVGDALLTAWVTPQGRRATMTVIAVPAGTFRLSGTVREPPLGVPGARVEVASGTGRGLSVATSPGGLYRLYGVGPDSQVRVTHPDYESVTLNGPFTAHVTRDVTLTRLVPVPQIGGVWSLAITAAAGCALPDEMRTRAYTATIVQDGPALNVILSGATFARGWTAPLDRFPGAFEGSSARLTLFDNDLDFYGYYTFPGVAEQVSATTFFVPVGTIVAGEVTSTRVAGSLDGTISVRTGAPANLRTAAECRAPNHQVVFTR